MPISLAKGQKVDLTKRKPWAEEDYGRTWMGREYV